MSGTGDSNPDKASSPPIADLIKIKEWLQPTPFDQEKSEYSRHRASHLTGTGKWLTSLGVFQQWHSGENGLLWITGIPASGKSVMAASIIHQLQKEKVPVLYFFFRQIIDANHRPVAALRDWLCQILDYSPSLQIELNDYRKKDRAIDSVSLDDFWGLLKKALSDIPKAYCVIDALDEMDKGNEKFLEDLAQLGKWRASHVKVLMTSRPVAVLESSLRMFNIPQIRLEERLVDTDIATYVQYNLQRSSIPQENWEIIKEVIPGRANGLFLYAKLSMDAFLEPGADPTEVLKALPANLNMMYDDLLRNSAKQYGVPESLQLLVLQFVTHATRPLRLLELADMINAVYSESETHQPKTPRQTKDWVRATCGPLIEILPDETVSVIHHSMTEFLKGLNRASDSTTYPVLQPGATNEGLAVSCLKYLRSGCLDKYEVKKRSEESLYRFSKKSQQSGPRLQFPFLEYAAENWPTHARRAAKDNADMTYLYAMLDVFFTHTQQFRAWLDLAWPTIQIENVTPLHVAAHFGLVDYAAHLLERKEIEIEARDQADNTPIYWAASPGNAEVVRLLLENGAEPDASQEEGLKPLHAASRNNHPEVVRLLLAAGVSPLTYKTAGDPGVTCGNAPTSYGHTALMYACHNGHVDVIKEYLPYLNPEASYRGLAWAAKKSRANIVKLLLEIPGVDVNGKYRGDTTLYTACRNINRDPETMKILLQAGADPNIICKDADYEFARMTSIRMIRFFGDENPNHSEPRGFTALHAFCRSSPTLEGMQLLLQAGADVHIKTPDGQTALHLACKNSYAYSIVESLLHAGLNPTEEDDEGSTPLHTCGSTDEKLLPILLKTGRVDINKRRSKDGWTPLRCRLEHYGSSFLDFLQYKPDVNITDNNGNSILHSAVSTYRIKQERLTAILSAGADAKAKNLKGESILHVIGHGAKLETLRLLLDAGADIEARDQEGQTPLFKYVKNSHQDELFILFRMLIDLGANIHARDYKGQTLLHHASGQTIFMDHLIGLGLNPDLTDNDGNTPLHTAASVRSTYPSSRIEALRYFVDRGLDLDQPNHGGRTPLHMLCMFRAHEEEAINYVIASSKSLSVSDINGIQPLHIAATISQSYVLILLNAGADVFGTTNEGMTVLQIAARAHHPNIIGLVLERALKAGKERQVSFVNQRNEAGKTALHYACTSGHLESVRALLEAGADPNLQENDGSSPFIASLCHQKNRAQNHPGRLTSMGDSRQEFESFVSSMIFIDNEKQTAAKSHGSSQDENDTREKSRMEEIFGLLIRHGAVVSGENGCFEKAFRSALSAGNDYAVKCLIQVHTRLQIEKPLSIIDPDMKYLTCIKRLEDAKRTLLERDNKGGNENNAGKLLLRRIRQDLLKTSLSESQYEAFEELVMQGAGPSEVYLDGTSILHHLASHGFGDLLSRFCSWETALAFDDPGRREKMLNEGPQNQRSIKSLLSTACSRDAPNMDVVRRLVEIYGVDVNALSKIKTPNSKPGQEIEYEKVRGSRAIHKLARGTCWWHAAEALPYLIKKGANIELRDKIGRTPLHIALAQSKNFGSSPFHGEVIRYLIENGADVNAVDDKGRNCLSIVVDDLRLTKYLIANGANVTSEAVFNAIMLMKVEILDLLLSQDNPKHQHRLAVRPSRSENDCSGFSESSLQIADVEEDSEILPLFYAAIQRDPSYKPIPNFLDRKMRIMSLLLGYGADPYASFTVRKVLARSNYISIFEYPDVDTECEMQETTIIHDLLARGLCTKPILILPSLDIEARDGTGRTLLLAASQSYSVNKTTSDGREHEPEPSNTVFRDLVDRGADVMAQDNKGRTILHHMCHFRPKKNEHSPFGEVLRGIIAKSPGLIHLVDEAGETALHHALRSNNTDYRDFLVENGSDLLLPDKDGNTILHSLARDLRNKKDNENLLNSGVDINSRNHQGDTPLSTYIQEHVHQAVQHPFFDFYYSGPKDEEYTDPNFLFFKEKGADFFTINNAGSSLLHLIAGVKLSSDNNGIHKFAKKILADRFKFLMRMGLDPMAEDAQLRTSIDVAAACGNEHIVKIFERKPLD